MAGRHCVERAAIVRALERRRLVTRGDVADVASLLVLTARTAPGLAVVVTDLAGGAAIACRSLKELQASIKIVVVAQGTDEGAGGPPADGLSSR